MRHSIYFTLALLSGCAPTTEEAHDPVRPRLGVPAPAATIWLAFDTFDRPVRFDPTTGATLEVGPALAGVDRDLAVDPWTGRVAVFSSPEGDGGMVHVLDSDLSPEEGDFPVDGRAELWFGSEGLWLFEESYGERWRRIRRDGVWEPSWGVPVPSSVWADGSSSFGAIVHDADHATWARIDSGAVTNPIDVLPFAGIVPSRGAARGAPMPDGVAVAWTTTEGIAVCVVDGQGAVIHERMLHRPGEVRQAATLITPDGPWLALALRDVDHPSTPSSVVALDPYGDSITADHVLVGQLSESRRVDRRMVGDGARLVLATTAGLQALVLSPDPPTLGADPSFDGAALRGPIERRGTMFFQSEDPWTL